MFVKILIINTYLIVFCSATLMNTCANSAGILPNATYSINSYTCESTPCICYLGCTSVINVDFKSPKYLDNITPNILASCMGADLNYPLNQEDACDGFTNTQCPIVENEDVNYRYQLTIPAIFPEVTVTLRFSIIDNDTGDDVLCFEWDIMVKKETCPPV